MAWHMLHAREQEEHYKEVIAELAEKTGRKVCNCGEAFYNERGECAGGCSTNQTYAKYEVGALVKIEK